jgi:transposase
MHSKSAPRRRHSSQLKATVLAACNEPGASISGVALAHGLNANLVRKWRAGRGLKRAGVVVESFPKDEAVAPMRPMSAASPQDAAIPEFVAIEMPSSRTATPVAGAGQAQAEPSVEPLIHVELRRGPLHLNVRWPTSAAGDCTAWLRELFSGLIK